MNAGIVVEQDYPGFDKAREQWKANPHCTACGRHTDTVNSLTGVMCEFCTIIWYDAEPPACGRWNPETLGAECKRREAAGAYPFKRR